MVHIDYPSTGCAGPAFPLGFDKRPDAISPDCFKIVDHTHTVLLPVPLVQMAQPFAGEFSTSMMIPALYLVAGRNGSALVAPAVGGVTPVAVVFLAEERHADSTVHAIGCNQGCFEGVLHRHE